MSNINNSFKVNDEVFINLNKSSMKSLAGINKIKCKILSINKGADPYVTLDPIDKHISLDISLIIKLCHWRTDNLCLIQYEPERTSNKLIKREVDNLG